MKPERKVCRMEGGERKNIFRKRGKYENVRKAVE
jgi:hypothetical protein